MGMFRFQAATTASTRAYQVQIRDEYLDQLYQFDAGSVEQEIYARAEQGVIIVVTDRPESIFLKLGDAVKSVTYLGPTADLPLQPVFANHSAIGESRLMSESDNGGFAEGLWPDVRSYLIRARAFAVKAGLLAFLPFRHAAGSVLKKTLPARTHRVPRPGEES